MAHVPFGWGPRSCIGMRLALMEAKMALVAVLNHYKLVEGPDTQKVNSNHNCMNVFYLMPLRLDCNFRGILISAHVVIS